LLCSYGQKIIALIKSDDNNIFNKNIKNKEKSKIKLSTEKKSEIDLEEELQIQLKKIKELEEKLALQDKLLVNSNNKNLLVLDNVLEIDNNTKSSVGLKYILDFLTNEVTYLANEEHKIYLFLEIIKNSLHNKEQLNFIERELNSSHLINNLANELYTRDKMPLLFEEFNTFKIFSSVSNLYYRSFLNENIIFNVYIEPKLAVKMVSDVAKVKSLIVHLINNVYGFITKGGVIDFLVFSGKEKDVLIIEISAFMPSEVKNIKSFFKTKQVTHSIITKDQGLGLSVSSNLINILDGKLKLTKKGSDKHSFRVSIPVKVVPEKKKKEFLNKRPIKIAILMGNDDYAYQNLKRYLIAFNIPESNILVFKNHKKMSNMKFSHLFCFENMLLDKFDMSHFPSVTILKYKEEKLEHSSLNKIKVNELIINAYYGMALQQILFPHLPVEEVESGTMIIEDSFLKKFNNVVNMLKFT